MKNVKKILVLMMVAVMLLSLAACGKKDKGTTGNGGNSGGAEGESAVAGEIFEFKLEIAGDEFELPADLSDFKDAGWTYLGNSNPEERTVIGNGTSTVEMMKDNQRISLTVVNKSGDMKMVSECKVGSIAYTFSGNDDVKMNLANGLTLKKGMSSEDIIDKWGEPTTITESDIEKALYYVKETNVDYVFMFDGDDKLDRVNIENWNFTVEDSASVEKDLSFMNNYKAPIELSSNYMDYICRIDNKLYAFPAPISEFLADGWEVESNGESVPSGQSVDIKLIKGDYNLTCSAKNYASVEVELEEVMATGVYINNDFLDVDFEISGGITFGMSIADFKEKVDVSRFQEKQITDEMTKFELFEPGTGTWYITFKNGKFTEVNFQCFKSVE